MVALNIQLDAGMDVHARDNRGRTVLHMLESLFIDERCKIEVARELLERGWILMPGIRMGRRR